MTEPRPTRFATVAVLGVTLGATAGMALAVGQGPRVAVGAAAALVLAGALHAAGADRFRPLAAGLVALALPLVGFVLVATAGATVVAQLRGSIQPGSVFLVVGTTVAVFGATAAAGDALDPDALIDALAVGVRVVVVASLAVATAALLQFAPLARAVTDALAGAVGAVLSPAPGRVHLGTWLALVAAATLGLGLAGRSLPVGELLGPRLDDRRRERLARVDRWALPASLGLGVAAALALAAEWLFAPYAGFPAPLRSLGAAVTGAAVLRWLLVVVVLLTATATGLAALVRRGYRTTGSDLLARLAPLGAALALVGGTVAVAERMVATLIDELGARLPAALASDFRDLAPSVVEFYGSTLIALLILAGALVVAFVLVTAAYTLVVSGLVPPTASGAAVASTGVFVAAAFAVVVDAPLPVALAGVLASVLIWDAGEYGTTLGRELGSRVGTLRTELVHAGGTVLIGCCTVVAVLSLLAVARGLDTGGAPVVPALSAALVGAVFLAVASR